MLLSWELNKKAMIALPAAAAEDPRIHAVISAAKTLAWPQELAWKVKSRLDKKYLPFEDNKAVEVIKELQELQYDRSVVDMLIAAISIKNLYGFAVCTDLMLVSYVEMTL